MAERCQAIAKSGKPCGATVVADGMCAWHAPSWEAKRRSWSAAGGAARSNRNRAKKALPAELLTMAEVQSYLGVALKGVLAGRIEPGVGTALANIARAMRDVGAAVDLEERLTDMARQIAAFADDRRPA